MVINPRWAKFCGWMLKKMGWTSVGGPIPEKKGVILGVPHTSMKDFIVSYFFYTAFGKVAHVLIKKEFFIWPLGPVLRAMGCIPVDRTNGATFVRSLIDEMNKEDEFVIAICPEGTRKPIKKWKTGYHIIAKAVGCPVYAGYFDWGTHRISAGEKFELTDDARADTARLQAYYEEKHMVGCHPEGYITH